MIFVLMSNNTAGNLFQVKIECLLDLVKPYAAFNKQSLLVVLQDIGIAG